MGVLKQVSTGRCVTLPEHAVVGRAVGSAVLLSEPAASNDHAAITWTGSRWEARDLGSTNGTTVNGAGLVPGQHVPLALGSTLRFGSPREEWELSDDGRPESSTLEGGAGQIRTHKAAGVHLRAAQLTFFVTLDERHVRAEAVEDDRCVRVPEKACFLFLVKLAEKRLQDAAQATRPEEEHGWIHVIDLIGELHVEEGTLNVHVKRARDELVKAGLEGAEGIVERRPREIRIGTPRIRVVRQ